MQIATIGLDLAKHVFQLHGVGPDGCVILRRKLRRTHMMPFFDSLPPCLIVWKPAPLRTTGRVNSARLATRFG
jgi:transposase